MDDKNRRIPILASGVDMGKNIFNRYKFGMDIADREFGKLGEDLVGNFNVKSVGGALSSGIGISALGAGLGAAAGAVTEFGAIPGAMIGAVTAPLALPALGFTTKGTMNIIGAAGKGLYHTGKNALKAGATGGGSMAALSSIAGNASIAAGTAVGVAAGQAAGAMVAIGEKMIKKNQIFNGELHNLKLSGFGKATLVTGALAIGVKNALKEEDKIRMGQRDSYVTTATPQTPRYSTNAEDYGASGDLVFAMNNLRRQF